MKVIFFSDFVYAERDRFAAGEVCEIPDDLGLRLERDRPGIFQRVTAEPAPEAEPAPKAKKAKE